MTHKKGKVEVIYLEQAERNFTKLLIMHQRLAHPAIMFKEINAKLNYCGLQNLNKPMEQ